MTGSGEDLPLLGRHNPRLKELRHLQTPSERARTSRFLIEGPRVVGEALDAGLALEWLLVAQGAAGEARAQACRARDAGVEVCRLDAEVLERLSPARTSQGLLGVARLPGWTLDDVLRGDLLVLLEGIQDPGNLGTLLRTARAAGAGGALVLGGADPFNPRAVRAAAGALFRLPVLRLEPGPVVLEAVTRAGFEVATAEAHGGQDLYGVGLPRRMALVLGAEVEGVSAGMRQAASLRLTIPLAPGSESLNVAAAGAVLLFEYWRRNRPGPASGP